MFSAIIPAYRMGPFIGAALESIAAQEGEDWEVIVVDDCAPDDGTAAIVGDFAAHHGTRRVEFIRHEVNTGVSGARNTAISAARGEFLAFLDPDDLWLPGYLRRISAEFAAHPEVDVVATGVEAFRFRDGKEIVHPIRFETWQIRQFPHSLALGNFMQPSSVVVRREAVDRIGGFDETPELQHIEDYDLWIRLHQAGSGFRFVNEGLVRYRKHEGAATSDRRRMQRLHECLTTKHAAFFAASQISMMRFMMNRIERTKASLKNPVRALLKRFSGR